MSRTADGVALSGKDPKLERDMRISVVTTMYHSAGYLEAFYQRALATVTQHVDEVEFIFVDDGSPDNSAQVARRFLQNGPKVTVVELSRNYGHHRAIMIGLAHAHGDLVFLVDCDLEEPPELFNELYRAMCQSEAAGEPADVVYAVPCQRKGGWFERVSGECFYRLFNFVTGLQIPRNWMIARLMRRRYVQALLAHQEREIFLGGLLWLTGFRQTPIQAEKIHKGSTTWSLRKKLRVVIEAFTSFSDRPLRLMALAGVLMFLASLLGIAYLVFQSFVIGTPYSSGWPSVILTIALFGSLNLFAVATVGIYVARVFVEVKRRPCIIKKTHANHALSSLHISDLENPPSIAA